MPKKPSHKKSRKQIPGSINAGGIFARPDQGTLLYSPRKTGKGLFDNDNVRLMAHLSKNTLKLNFIISDTGLSFSFSLEDKKEVKAFVDFVAKAYQIS
jgi:hypothetical protein